MKKHIYPILLFLLIPFIVLSQQEQIENPGFEEWEDAGTVLYEPVNWSSIKTSDNPQLAQFAPVVWDRSEDAHTGNYSVYLFNVFVSTLEITATGTLTNGRTHASVDPAEGYAFTQADDPQWFTPFQSKPDSLVGWFKCNPMEGDTGGIRAIIHVDEGKLPANGTEPNWIAEANHQFPGYVVSEWTRFSVPFNYYSENTPAYLLIVVKAGNGTLALPDSELWLDDLELIYNDPGAINELKGEETILWFYDDVLNFKSMSPDFYHNTTLFLHDLNGRLVFEQKVTGNRVKPDIYLEKGIYIARIVTGSMVRSQKIYIY